DRRIRQADAVAARQRKHQLRLQIVRPRPNHPIRGIQAITALRRWQSRTSIRPRTYSGRLDPFVIAEHSASEDARERAYDPAIHPLRKKSLRTMMEHPKSGLPDFGRFRCASRVNPTCVVKPAGDACGCGMLNQTEGTCSSIRFLRNSGSRET